MTDVPPLKPTSRAAAANAGVRRSYASLRSIAALTLREMATRYGRSPGGYIWAILEPLGAILILALAFSLLVRVPPLGNSFILFFATGFMPFSMYNNLQNNVARSINFSRALLFYPAVNWVDAVFARLILNTLTDVLVMLVLFFCLITILDLDVLLDIKPVLTSIGLVVVLSFGIGLVNCVLFGFYPVWMSFWGVLNRPMFLASGSFFLFEDIPAVAQEILWWNPLIHITALMRKGFYPTYDAAFASPVYVLAVSLITMFFGVLLMGRYHREILNN